MIFPKNKAPDKFIIQWPKDSYCVVSTTSNSPIWATNSETSNLLPQPPSTLEFSTNPAIADRRRYLFTQLATHIISTWDFILLIATFKCICSKWKTEPTNRTLQWETWCMQEWGVCNTQAGLMHEHQNKYTHTYNTLTHFLSPYMHSDSSSRSPGIFIKYSNACLNRSST